MAQRSRRDGARGRRLRNLARLWRGHRGLVAGLAVAACLAAACLVAWRAWGLGQGTLVERGAGQGEAPSVAASSEGGGAGDAQGEGAEGGALGSDGSGEGTAEPSGAEGRVTVIAHVDGAVASPGVYELSGSSPRVRDLVEAAGGLRADADTSTVNLAAVLADGQKVHVPAQGEATGGETADVAVGSASGGGSATGGEAAGGGSTTGGEAAGGLVNINTASAEELQTLPGVGEATARAIIQERTDKGPFKSKEDLMRVSGIGEKKFAKVKELICV